MLFFSGVDPDPLNPDPDPAFQVNPDPYTDPGFDDQKFNKKVQLNFVFFFKNLQFTYP